MRPDHVELEAAHEARLADDVAAIRHIDAVPRILEVVCRTTGMGFAAVARVTEQRWIACAVRDEIAFGLVPGGELRVATTICNEIRQHGRLVVIDDVSTDTAFKCHPTPAQYGFRSYISMPICVSGGRFFGTLCAIDPHPARLNTPEIVGMFSLFAELIAFHLEARDRVSELEIRVAERTAELSALNLQLERTREEERTRIARELHDELGQSLTAMAFDIAAAKHCLDRPEREAAHDLRGALDSMASITSETLDGLERIIAELRPAVLDTLGIGAAVESIVAEFGRRANLRATSCCGDDDGISPTAGTLIFRILQEALTNIARHAHASEVNVVLTRDSDDVVLIVEDDGCGIVPGAVSKTAGWGLRGMHERLRAHNGVLLIAESRNGGTTVTARCRADAA